jgi:hypothetical protein
MCLRYKELAKKIYSVKSKKCFLKRKSIEAAFQTPYVASFKYYMMHYVAEYFYFLFSVCLSDCGLTSTCMCCIATLVCTTTLREVD